MTQTADPNRTTNAPETIEALRKQWEDNRGAMRSLVDAGGMNEPDKQLELAQRLEAGKDIQKKIDIKLEIDGQDQWAARSSGMLGLAAPGATVPEAGEQDPRFAHLPGSTAEHLYGAGQTYATPADPSQDGRFAGRLAARGLYTGDLNIQHEYGEGVFAGAMRSVISKPGYRAAYKEFLRTPASRHPSDAAMRALQEGVDSSGGFLVPEDILARVISRVPTPTRVQARVTQLSTGRDALTIPKIVYTADDLYTTAIRVKWTGEIPASSTTHRVTEPLFGQLRIPIFTAMLSIPLTNDMIEDAAFPLVDYISGKFGETIDLLKDNMVLNGAGQSQPEGVLVAPDPNNADVNQPKVIQAASASPAASFSASDLVSMAMALPEQYDDNSAWIFNKVSTAATIANMQDSNKRFMWGAGLQDSGLEPGFRNRALLGYPVVLSGFMPNTAASSFPIIFGDLSSYYLVNRVGFSIQVLRELYAETNQILVLGRIRFGGVLAEPWKLRILQAHA